MAKSTSYTCDLCKLPIGRKIDVMFVSIGTLIATRLDDKPIKSFDMHRECANAVDNDIRYGHIARNHKLLHDSDD